MKELLKKWLLRFIRPDALPQKNAEKDSNTKPKEIWDVDISDSKNWLDPYKISIGSAARKTLFEMSSEDQSTVLKQVRDFFKEGTKKLLTYLPFGNKFLRSLKFLDPKHQKSSKYVRWVIVVAKRVPHVIGSDDVGSLEVESRLHQTLEHTIPDDMTVLDFWKTTDEKNATPTLVKLARAVLILPHGNAEVERIFSMLPDIITKKRSQLAPQTVASLVVTRSCMAAQGFTSANIPITNDLLDMAADAYANYVQRLKEKQRAEDEEKRKEQEKRLQAELVEEKRKNVTLNELEMKSNVKEKEIQHILEQKLKMTEVYEQAAKKMKDRDEELQLLMKQKEMIETKKKEVSNGIVERVLKRKCDTLSEGCCLSALQKLSKIPKHSKKQ